MRRKHEATPDKAPVRERRKKEHTAELDSLTKPGQVIELEKARLKHDLQRPVADTKSLLGRQNDSGEANFKEADSETTTLRAN